MNFKIFILIVSVLSFAFTQILSSKVLLAQSEQSGPTCANYDDLVTKFKKADPPLYVAIRAITLKKNLLEFWVSPRDGSWVAVMTSSDKNACIMDIGPALQFRKQEKPGFKI